MPTNTLSLSAALTVKASLASTDAPAGTITHSVQPTGAGLSVFLENGTADGQASKLVVGQATILAGADLDLDLAGGLTDFRGTATTFTAVKELMVWLEAPDGALAVRLGPQGATNAWQGPWGGTGATVYETVLTAARHSHPYAGWAVTAGTGDILRIHNPGGTSVVVNYLIAGV